MEPNWKGKTVFTGDNLYVMRGMNSESVDLIYLDPPFNSNRAYAAPIGSEAAGAAFKDTWTLSDVDLVEHNRLKEENVGLYTLMESAKHLHSKGMFSYLVMMAVRLQEMRRILKPTGSIYLHCDPTADSYLRLVMDGIFGHGNFRNEVVWCYRGGGVPKYDFARKHDVIFRYSKTKKVVFNVDDVRISYSKSVLESSTSRYDKSYRASKVYSGYRPNEKGKHPEDWWEIQPIMPSSKERIGYPTQKPLKLLERIIKASSNRGDVVLDPFCGCAMTMVAAEDLGRNWMGIDISPKAVELVVSRIRDRQGLFRDITHRDDIPRRTDLGEELRGKGKDECKKTLYGLQEGYCNGCHEHFQIRNFHMDHITPRAKGGTDHAENYQLLCGDCNHRKGTKSQAEFKALLAKEKGISTSWI